MKTITIVAIIAAVVVVGGACAGIAFSGVLNGGMTGPGGDNPVVPTEPVEPTPTETPTETPTPTPTETQMSYFSPMTSSGSGSSSGGDNTPTHTHKLGNWKSIGNSKHDGYCTECSEKVVESEACSYGYYQYTGSDDSRTHTKFCDKCGDLVTENCDAASVHDEGAETHTEKCTLCHTKFGEPVACFPESNEDESKEETTTSWSPDKNAGTHSRKCDTCGHVYTEACTTDAGYKKSEDGSRTHTLKGNCECGREGSEKSEPVACFITYTYVQDSESHQHTLKCEQCTADYGTEGCSISESYTSNNNGQHTKTEKCASCTYSSTSGLEDCSNFGQPIYNLQGENPTVSKICTECEYLKTKPVVASIDSVGYTTLSDAITEAKEGETVKLLRDDSSSVTIDKSIILDINKKSMSGTISYTDAAQVQLMGITSPTDVKVKIGDAFVYPADIGGDGVYTALAVIEQDGLRSAADIEKSYIIVRDVAELRYIANNYETINTTIGSINSYIKDNTLLMYWSVKIGADIDFKHASISPIPWKYQGMLDGQNHVIKNVNVAGDENQANVGIFTSLHSVKDLSVENVHVTSKYTALDSNNKHKAMIGTIAGMTNGDWTNVHVNGFSLTGDNIDDYLGGLVGNSYGNKTDCTVANGKLTGGKNVGGFAGYVGVEVIKKDDEYVAMDTILKDCSVSNVEIDAFVSPSTIGGFAGRLNNAPITVTVEGQTVILRNTLTLTNCKVTSVSVKGVPTDKIYVDIPNDPVIIDGKTIPEASSN